jgi:gluconokinase
MGVAGCGKSSIAQQVATALGWRLIEGDEFHSDANRERMRRGIALTDQDRAAWLATLADELRSAPRPVVLTCSALKAAYRAQLRNAAPGLRFAFLQIAPDVALQRVAARASHFFSPGLVSSQFAALEDPSGEPGVLTLDATASLAELCSLLVRWIETEQAKEFQ